VCFQHSQADRSTRAKQEDTNGRRFDVKPSRSIAHAHSVKLHHLEHFPLPGRQLAEVSCHEALQAL
jgi:hypothetical protein